MPSSKQEVQSLLTEHFRYTPLTLIDDIINTVNEISYRAVDAVEAGLSSTPATSLGFTPDPSTSPNTSTLSNSDLSPDQQDAVNAVAKAEIETGVHQLETLLESNVDSSFDRLEIYLLRNILTIPEGLERWIRLRHYDGLDFSTLRSQAHTQDQPSAEDLIRKRRKLHETQKLNASLRAESARNTALVDQLRMLLTPPAQLDPQSQQGANISFLQHSPQLAALRVNSGSSQASPVTVQTQAALAQLPQLKKLVTQLREAQAKGFSAPKRAAKDEERERYIERGVEAAIGKVGNSSGGLGPKVSREDVQGIETVARAFGK